MMSQINEFPRSVIEKLGYYVYLLSDPTTNKVFYVGKGTGNRIFAHINSAIASPLESDKLDKIRSIQTEGLQVKHSLIRHGLTEKEALEAEAALIDFIDIRELTNVVLGHDSDSRGLMSIADVIAKYLAPEIEIDEPAILITVNRLFRRNMSDDEIYEITRGNRVVGERKSRAKYAFCVYNGIVRQVYEIQRWFPVKARSQGAGTQNRWRFDGVVSQELQHYVGGTVEKYVGAQNPIRYVNCRTGTVAHKAFTRTPHGRRNWRCGSLRVFKQSRWLDVDSGNAALPRPTRRRQGTPFDSGNSTQSCI